MITKKDVLENRTYLGHIFNFEVNLKFHATQKIYDKMREENFDAENIDYSEITSYKVLMININAYLKSKKNDQEIQVSEVSEVSEELVEPLEKEALENQEFQKEEENKEEQRAEKTDNIKINLDFKFPRNKDTDLSIINYLF